MPIYTKKGDKGRTSTFLGEADKSDELVEALGSIDELNSWIGLCRGSVLDGELKNIQTNLLIIGSSLAGSRKMLRDEETKKLEKLIDKLTDELPKLANFIYPVGEMQVARAVARRCERNVVKVLASKNILKYLNRLSDALFVMGRWINFKSGIQEEVWK